MFLLAQKLNSQSVQYENEMLLLFYNQQGKYFLNMLLGNAFDFGNFKLNQLKSSTPTLMLLMPAMVFVPIMPLV